MTDNQGVQYSIMDLLDDTKPSDMEPEDTDEIEKLEFDFSTIFNENDTAQEMMDNGQSLAILGDSLSVLKSIRDKSIDLVFADAPYNIGKDFGNNSDKWDSVQSYIDWCKEWIDECIRILKDTGTMYFMTATQHMPYLDVRRYGSMTKYKLTYDETRIIVMSLILYVNSPCKYTCKTNFNFQRGNRELTFASNLVKKSECVVCHLWTNK